MGPTLHCQRSGDPNTIDFGCTVRAGFQESKSQAKLVGKSVKQLVKRNHGCNNDSREEMTRVILKMHS
jgi:hypothetical protein